MCVCVRVCVSVCVCECVYLDLAGILGVVDVVKRLFDGLSQGHHSMVPQDQHLYTTHTHTQWTGGNLNLGSLETILSYTVPTT